MYLDDMFSLKGKVALVTGGGRGIGQFIARGLAKAGAKIAIVSRTGAQETVDIIERDGGTIIDLIADVTVESEVDSALNKIVEQLGSLDIVFDNAGICIHKDALEATVDEWRQVIDINLTGAYIVARSAASIMIKRGIAGSIINNASMSGSVVNIPQMQASYNASKAGLIHLTRSLAIEWANNNIRVNAISAGPIKTLAASGIGDFRYIMRWNEINAPMRRNVTTVEVGHSALYLLSDLGSGMTGEVLHVDSGYHNIGMMAVEQAEPVTELLSGFISK